MKKKCIFHFIPYFNPRVATMFNILYTYRNFKSRHEFFIQNLFYKFVIFVFPTFFPVEKSGNKSHCVESIYL